MSKIIQVENLSKKYIIGHQQLKGNKTFREAISQNIAHLGSKFVHPFSKKLSSNSPFEEFWALKDINFDVEQGDRIGIIGRNGAGKSTLLKVLSRITEPSSGKITIKGRVASLLEVGTGFHPELTGRENIFLNGAILGMHRAEIRQKFDEIVDFSGVEKFLDTPVKRYSSGMYVRLAFAVAAHLEPEILIVDEVLAVGDAEFQTKCIGKMQDISQKGGRTVIFVSHNMNAIQTLCSKIIILDKGSEIFNGSVSNGIDYYINQNIRLDKDLDIKNRTDRIGNGKLRITGFQIIDENEDAVIELLSGKTYCFKLTYNKHIPEILKKVYVSMDIHGLDERRHLMFANNFEGELFELDENKNEIVCKVDRFPLTKGQYFFTLWLQSYATGEVLDGIDHISYFEVIGGDFFGTGSIGNPDNCKMLYDSEWKVG